MPIPIQLDEITEKWLSKTLSVPVKSVSIEPVPAHNSIIGRLTVAYAGESEIPEKLIVKLKTVAEGLNECWIYDTSPVFDFMIPHYYWDYDDDQSGDSILILKDISGTHAPLLTINDMKIGWGVPQEKHLNMIVDALADWHSHWWRNSNSIDSPYFFQSDKTYKQRVQKYHDDWAQFDKTQIPDEWAILYENALKYVESLWDNHIARRYAEDHNLTVIHGDCYLNQFFVNDESAYIADFDSIAMSIPADDLVFLMATFWTREQRTIHEEKVLRRYHARLNKENYSWGDLLHDYRMMLLFRVFHPVWDANNGSSEAYWKTKMQCLIHAYQDWDVEAVFCTEAG